MLHCVRQQRSPNPSIRIELGIVTWRHCPQPCMAQGASCYGECFELRTVVTAACRFDTFWHAALQSACCGDSKAAVWSVATILLEGLVMGSGLGTQQLRMLSDGAYQAQCLSAAGTPFDIPPRVLCRGGDVAPCTILVGLLIDPPFGGVQR